VKLSGVSSEGCGVRRKADGLRSTTRLCTDEGTAPGDEAAVFTGHLVLGDY
jgi:hypothetical protein